LCELASFTRLPSQWRGVPPLASRQLEVGSMCRLALIGCVGLTSAFVWLRRRPYASDSAVATQFYASGI
jgi:hypothetical protein